MRKAQPVKIIDGFEVFAPGLIEESATFVTDAHSRLEEYEKKYFWFSERRKLIYFFIKKYFSTVNTYCEIGCGGGYLLSELKTVLSQTNLYGTEIFINGLKIAKKRCPDAEYFQSDILDFPFESEFDLIGLFDVIEHIDDDNKALKSIFDALTPGGGAIISVPQHKWLWTGNDVYACHKRRYSRNALAEKCRNTGFEIIRSTSYTSLLLPAFMVNCLLNKKKTITDENAGDQFKINPLLNFLFKIICKIELILTKIGINFYLGVSLILIVRKRTDEKNTI